MAADIDHKDGKPKVHFDDSHDAFDHDANILLTPIHDGYNVHLGFLQVNHWYHISFSFSIDSLSGPISRDESEVPATNIKLLEVVVKKNSSEHCAYHLKVELFAFKEKLFKEKLVMKSSDQRSITLVLNARVLGKGKGTPLLRNGITCVGVKNDGDDDSELSDWQGFEKQH